MESERIREARERVERAVAAKEGPDQLAGSAQLLREALAQLEGDESDEALEVQVAATVLLMEIARDASIDAELDRALERTGWVGGKAVSPKATSIGIAALRTKARALASDGFVAESAALLDRALAKIAPNDPQAVVPLVDRAFLASMTGDRATAIKGHRSALEIIRVQSLPLDPVFIADVEAALGGMLTMDDEASVRAEGREALGRAVPVYQRELGEECVRIAEVESSLARASLLDGDQKASVKHALKSLDLKTKAFGRDHPAVADGEYELGCITLAFGDFAEATTWIEEAIGTWERAQTKGYPVPDLAMVRENLKRAIASKGV